MNCSPTKFGFNSSYRPTRGALVRRCDDRRGLKADLRRRGGLRFGVDAVSAMRRRAAARRICHVPYHSAGHPQQSASEVEQGPSRRPEATFLPKHGWAIRVRLELADRILDLALFNLATGSKLRGCDLPTLCVADVYAAGPVKERAFITQSKTNADWRGCRSLLRSPRAPRFPSQDGWTTRQ